MSEMGAVDMAKLEKFIGGAVGDLAATAHAALVVVGDQLGLYRAMANVGPMTPAALAKKTETNERYVREWLHANAAAGFVTYDPKSGAFTLPPEQSFALGTEGGPASIAGAFAVIQALWMNLPKMVENF